MKKTHTLVAGIILLIAITGCTSKGHDESLARRIDRLEASLELDPYWHAEKNNYVTKSQAQTDTSSILRQSKNYTDSATNTLATAFAIASGYNLIDRSVASVTAPVEEIGNYALSDCHNLTNAVFPHAKKVGYMAFQSCNSLTSLSLPEVRHLEPWAFYACTALPSFEGPLVTNVMHDAFNGCLSLSRVSLGSATNRCAVADSVFKNCISLTNIVLYCTTAPNKNIFDGCTSSFDFYLYLPDGVSVDADQYKAMTAPMRKFSVDCDNIGWAALENITSLDEIALIDTATIEGYAFNGCTALASASIDSVTSIGDFAFQNTTLETVYCPLSTAVGFCGFQYCASLRQATFKQPTSFGELVFNGCDALEKITFTAATKSEVMSASNFPWSARTACVFECSDGTISYTEGTWQ